MRTFSLSIALFYIFGSSVIQPCWSGVTSDVITSGAANIKARRVLVVAGNFSIDGELVNIAQYDIATKEWSPKYVSELYLYGESNGIIWDIVVNKTSQPFNKLFVVGAFDTVSETSQIQFCSVGEWDGLSFDKVGEGLCPRGGDSSTAMSIQTAALGNDGDIFVGGSFESRVWDGHHFVNVYHVAHFDGRKSSWLPLVGSQLSSDNSQIMPRVNTLSWDAEGSVLYLGGSFYAVEGNEITPGLAMWTESSGLLPFPGGGLFRDSMGVSGVALRIAYEPTSNALFVAGLFRMVNDIPCQNIAVWVKRTNEWVCLYQSSKAFSTVTSMLLHNDKVYVTGWAAADSDWSGRTWGSPYAIAVMDIEGFVQENQGGGSGGCNSSTGGTGGGSGAQNPPNSSSQYSSSSSSSSSGGKGRGRGGGGEGNESDTEYHHHLPSQRITNQKRMLDLHHRNQKYKSSFSSSQLSNTSLYDLTRDPHDSVSGLADLLKIFQSSSMDESSSDSSGRSRRQAEADASKHSRYRKLRQEHKKSRRRKLDYVTRAPSHSPVSPPSSNSSAGGGASNSSQTPTPSPVFVPWAPHWSWLPGYSGGNGPILRMTSGSESFEGYLFLVGAFNNYPAIALWYDDPVSGPYTVALPSKRIVQGFITAIAQVNLPFEDVPVPTPPPNSFHQKDYTLLILLSCVMVGVFLGVIFAICCNSQGYTKVESDDNNGELMMGIPLKTLSGGANYSVDFRECFERAMKARHLPTHESLLIINPKEIVLSKIIGEGSFGRVWNGQWRNNSVAVKEFVFAQAAIVGGSLERNNIIEEIVGEAGVMACLRHPKILQLYGCSLTMQAIWIVSEFCSRGSLRMLLNDNTLDLPFLKKVSICLDVADGMLYLHTRSPPIIHRDIKSHNIFITEPSPGHFVAKIGDWGSARAVALTGAKSMTQGVGTACWLAPEVINFAHASKDSDVYAFGIVLWEVYTRHEVYEGLSAAQIIAKVANEGLRPRVPRDCPWASIMTECWQQDASQRPGFHRVMTSLSKIYSRAKAANKGKAGTNSAISSPTGPNISDGPGSTPLPVNRSNLKSTTSIFQPTPSEDEVVRGGGGVLSGALATFTGKNTNNNPNRNGGVASIYFGNRNQATDQYLTVKPKLPSRVSSDPIRVFKQAEVMAEEHKGKTWSNDIFPKTLKSWPTTSDKSNVSGSSAPDSEKSVRLYDFSSTPTGVVAGSSSDGKKPSPKHSKHSSGQGSPLGSSAGSVRTMQSGPAGKKTSEGSTPGSGGDSSQRSSAAAAAGQVVETQGPDNPLLISGLFKALVDLGGGRSSPVEYVVIDEAPPADLAGDRMEEVGRRRSSGGDKTAKNTFRVSSLDSSQNNTPDSVEDDDQDPEGYSSIDNYNSMRVGRTESVTSEAMAMGMSRKTSFTFANTYESTRSESPPSSKVNFSPQDMDSSRTASESNSGAWSDLLEPSTAHTSLFPVKSSVLSALKDSSISPIEEKSLFLQMPRLGAPQPLSPVKVSNSLSPDLVSLRTGETHDSSVATPSYRGGGGSSRSRSAGRWSGVASVDLTRDLSLPEKDRGDAMADSEDELAGGYDTT